MSTLRMFGCSVCYFLALGVVAASVSCDRSSSSKKKAPEQEKAVVVSDSKPEASTEQDNLDSLPSDASAETPRETQIISDVSPSEEELVPGHVRHRVAVVVEILDQNVWKSSNCSRYDMVGVFDTIALQVDEIRKYVYANEKLKISVEEDCPAGGTVVENNVLESQDVNLKTTLTTLRYD